MSAPTLTDILNEINIDPAGLGYSNVQGQYNEITDMLNDVTLGQPMPQPIDMLSFAKWAAGNGTRQKLKDGQSNPTFGAICDLAIDMFAQLGIVFDPVDPLTQDMMGALAEAGIIDQTADVAAAVTFCTQSASRAANLWGWGVVITLDQVTAALTPPTI